MSWPVLPDYFDAIMVTISSGMLVLIAWRLVKTAELLWRILIKMDTRCPGCGFDRGLEEWNNDPHFGPRRADADQSPDR